MSSICNRFTLPCIRWITVAISILLLARIDSSECHAQQVKKTALSRWAEKIDSLATTNAKPELVDLKRGLPPSERIVPLFQEDYDWAEYSRVVGVFYSLGRYGGADLWEELIKHLDDDRYALTMSLDFSAPRNYTVGQLCYAVASPRVLFPERQRSNPDSRGRPDIRLDLGINDLAKWRKDREKKPLYALQIEVCERAIEQLDLQERVTEISKTNIRVELQSRIKQLTKDKRVYFFPLTTDGYNFYSSEKAKVARREIDDLKSKQNRD